MRTQNLVALVLCLLAAVQKAQADIAPNPPPPPSDQTLPVVLAGVCLSLAIMFFGLWLVNFRKSIKAKSIVAASAGAGANVINDLNQVSNSR